MFRVIIKVWGKLGVLLKELHNSSLLICNGGPISLIRTWAQSLLKKMGYVKQPASTKAKVTVADFEFHKALFLHDVKNIIVMDEIPPQIGDQLGSYRHKLCACY